MTSASIDKRRLWQYVNLKVKRFVHHYHVISIISILFDEMVKDLKSGKDIKIFNFGTLSLKKMPARKYFNVRHQRIMHSSGNKVLRFTLAPGIRKKLIRNLDLDKTLRND